MVAYFRAGRKASVVQLLDPGDAGERQRPAELQVQDIPLKRVDRDGADAEERPADRLRGRLRGLLPDRQDGCDVRPIRPYTPRPLAAY